MPNLLPVSVHILTWNSGKSLERALASVRGVKEILVIDGGSTDDTLMIAERHGARVLPQRFPSEQGKPLSDFAAARMVGLTHASEEWVLTLDSDEEMSPEAMEEIRMIASKPGGHGAYFVPRVYVKDDGTRIVHASTYPNERIYFFRRDAVIRWEKPVHEKILLKDGTSIGHLKHGSLASLPSYGAFVQKLNQYLEIEREQSRGKGWMNWFKKVWRTLKGRLVAKLRLLRIWLIPRSGARLPLRYECARFWYAWKLIVITCPLVSRATSHPPRQLS